MDFISGAGYNINMNTHRKILIVDDEEKLRTMLSDHLVNAGYTICEAGSCASAKEMMQRVRPDAVILDVMLPDGDGFSLFSDLRLICPDAPVLFLSARDEDSAKLTGLGLGADDYITKPFLLKELELRIAAVIRRVYGDDMQKTVSHFGTTTVNWGSAEVQRNDGSQTTLTLKEFSLLKKLYENKGNIVTIDALCSALWDGDLFGYENTLMVHVRKLREKIEEDPSHPQYILTARGLGYKMSKEVQ